MTMFPSKLCLNKNNKNLLLSQIVFEQKQQKFPKPWKLHIFVLKEKSMCTSNNHQLWLRNIYDHKLMVLSMVPKYLHESNQTFFWFRCTDKKLKSFFLYKITNITNKRFLIFNKRKFILDNINTFIWNMT